MYAMMYVCMYECMRVRMIIVCMYACLKLMFLNKCVPTYDFGYTMFILTIYSKIHVMQDV
jgi:hypothetical protein